MATYKLEIEAVGAYILSAPVLEVWADGVLHSTHSISSSGSSISLNISYSGSVPASLSFKFNDLSLELGREIDIKSVEINDQHINVGNYLSSDTLSKGDSTVVDITSSNFLFDDSDPSASEFSATTYTLTSNQDRFLNYNDSSDQVIDGLSGNDTIYTGAGADKINGNSGNDVLRGGAGNDLIFGDNGDDRIYGQDDDDLLYGGNGDDRIYGNNGDDEIHGGNNDDNLFGHAGNDTITGGNGVDNINGGDGDDILFGGNQNDILIASTGNDTADGGEGDDVIYGGSGNDIIDGSGGADTIAGDAGDDIINGGVGADDLYGGGDADLFIFDNASGVDTIHDFNAGEGDRIDMSNIVSYDSLVDVLANFVIFTESAGNTTISIDDNGLTGGINFTDVVVLEDTTGLNLLTLVLSDSVIV